MRSLRGPGGVSVGAILKILLSKYNGQDFEASLPKSVLYVGKARPKKVSGIIDTLRRYNDTQSLSSEK